MAHTQTTIEHVQIRSVVAPLSRPVKTASGNVLSSPLVLIDITASDGITGHSYIFSYTEMALEPLEAITRKLSDLLVGKSTSPLEIQSMLLASVRLLGHQGLTGMAISGIDMALWDLLARQSSKSLVELLGGTKKPVKAYDSFGLFDPENDPDAFEQSKASGFRAIKIKLGGGTLAEDLDTVGHIQAIIGPDVELMVDYNQSLSLGEALRRCTALEERGIYWIEEPVQADDLQGHAHLTRSTRAMIQTGENLWFPQAAREAVAAKASNYLMLDVMKIGGVSGWITASQAAAAGSVDVSSHIFPEVSVHCLAATPNVHFVEYLDIAGSILKEPLLPVNGCLTPSEVGSGVTWNEDAVIEYAHKG